VNFGVILIEVSFFMGSMDYKIAGKYDI